MVRNIFSLALLFSLSGGGGGGGAAAAGGTLIAGQAVKGPVKQGTVRAFAMDSTGLRSGNALGGARTGTGSIAGVTSRPPRRWP